jgi:hypothetical protein
MMHLAADMQSHLRCPQTFKRSSFGGWNILSPSDRVFSHSATLLAVFLHNQLTCTVRVHKDKVDMTLSRALNRVPSPSIYNSFS